MKRVARMLIGVGVALFLLVFTLPGIALADGCPQTLIAKIICPNRPGYYSYVCQEHPGIITFHSDCFPPE